MELISLPSAVLPFSHSKDFPWMSCLFFLVIFCHPSLKSYTESSSTVYQVDFSSASFSSWASVLCELSSKSPSHPIFCFKTYIPVATITLDGVFIPIRKGISSPRHLSSKCQETFHYIMHSHWNIIVLTTEVCCFLWAVLSTCLYPKLFAIL